MKRLPESELEIMMILWKHGGAMNRMEIEAQLQKEVAAPTVLSFLNRLETKGFVQVEKVGKINWYTPLVREEEYLRKESRNILQKLYRNSLRNFMASLYDGEGMSREELDELQAFLDEKSAGGNFQKPEGEGLPNDMSAGGNFQKPEGKKTPNDMSAGGDLQRPEGKKSSNDILERKDTDGEREHGAKEEEGQKGGGR